MTARKPFVWFTEKGRALLPEEMDSKHLVNSFLLVNRWLYGIRNGTKPDTNLFDFKTIVIATIADGIPVAGKDLP